MMKDDPGHLSLRLHRQWQDHPAAATPARFMDHDQHMLSRLTAAQAQRWLWAFAESGPTARRAKEMFPKRLHPASPLHESSALSR